MDEENNYEGVYWIETEGGTAYIRRVDGRDLRAHEIRRIKRLLRVFDEDDASLAPIRLQG
jgi:hypothetical protein